MSDVSSVVHLLPKANEGFITTLGSTISSGASTVPLNSTTGLTNGTTFVGIIEPGATNQQVFTGVIDTGGGHITGVKWTRGSNVGHAGGVTIVDYITGTAVNMITRWAGIEHNDDGTHNAVTASSVTTDALTVGGKDVSQLTPTGVIVDFAGSSAPTGWLICDGSSVLRSTYAALFAVIGTTYGSADGTHFNVPDLRSRVTVAPDASAGLNTSNNTLAATGGEATHVLTTGEMPAHAHGVNDPGHNHALWSIGQESNVYTLGGTSNRAVLIGGTPNSGNGVTGTRTTGISTQNNGSGTAHNNMQPYLVVNKIVKV